MGMTTEEILIRVNVDTSNLKSIEAINNRFGWNKKVIAKATAMYTKAQRLSNMQMAKGGKLMRTIMGASKKFKMELLSLGFGFQMISRGMFNLLQPAFETVGIFELFSTMLQVTFLPIALFVLENIMIPLFNIFTNLPEGIQLAIGAFVALLGVLAAIAAPIAFLGLFADSFVKGWLIIGKMLTPIWNFIKFFFTGIGALIAVVIVAIVGFWLAWKTNFARIRDWVEVIWEGIKQVIDGIKESIGGIIDIFVGLFTLDGEKIKEGFKKLLEGVLDIVTGLVKSIVGVIATIGISLLRGILALIPKKLRTLVADALGIGDITPTEAFAEIDKIRAGTKQTGGLIPHTGLYKLHRGETVVPSEQNLNFSPTINIMGGSGMDARAVANMVKLELNQQWAGELGRLARR